MEKLTFRLAQPSDFDEVLKLSEGVFGGYDYLPFKFHDWFKSDNGAVMLAHVGERLVALGACFIVDNGKTFIRRGERNLEEFRGRGISQQLLKALKEYIQRKFPSICRERFATTFAEFSADAWSRITLLLEEDLLSYQVKKQKYYRCLQLASASSVEVEVCTKEYFADVILSTPVAKQLFPNNIVTVEWSPFDPVPSNIQHMLEENDFILVDKCSNQTFPRSISFGRLSPRVEHVVWLVCVYTDDPVLFEAHLWHQLKRGCEVIEGDFVFIAGFHDKTFKAVGKKILEERLQVEKADFLFDKTIKVYERNFTDQCRT